MKNKLIFITITMFIILSGLVSSEENLPPEFIGLPAIPSTLLEGHTYTFGVQVYDPNDDPVSIEWYLNDALVSTTDEYDFYAGSDGSYNMTIFISDGELNDSISYILHVASGGGGGGGGTIKKNYILNNEEEGLLITGSDNDIYNNYFNNTENVDISNENINRWNTTLTPGENIFGGKNIGGNFWANPDGNGYSQTCWDVDKNGICDFAFTLDSDNIDYLPLSDFVPRKPRKISPVSNIRENIK